MTDKPKIKVSDQTSCLRCKRWKLFGHAPCTEHPDFKTVQELYEEKIWKDINENMSIMSFVSALRVFGSFGREDLFNRVLSNLELQPQHVIDAVYKQVAEMGPLSSDEVVQSMFAWQQLNGRA